MLYKTLFHGGKLHPAPTRTLQSFFFRTGISHNIFRPFYLQWDMIFKIIQLDKNTNWKQYVARA